MPDSAPSVPEESLDSLRAQIDAVDQDMLALVVKRAQIGQRIKAIKGPGAPFFRPAREAAVIRRLLAAGSGPLDPAVIGRLWREQISANAALQGPFACAVVQPDDRRGYWDVARDHFGAFVPMSAVPSGAAAVRTVTEGRATVAIVPWPEDDDAEPWWPLLLGEDSRRPRVVTRLPFVPIGNARGEERDALVVAQVPFEASGSDHTLMVLGLAEDMSRARLKGALEQAGLQPVGFCSLGAQEGGGSALHLIDLRGFMAPDSPSLLALERALRTMLDRVWIIGGYPLPLSS